MLQYLKDKQHARVCNAPASGEHRETLALAADKHKQQASPANLICVCRRATRYETINKRVAMAECTRRIAFAGDRTNKQTERKQKHCGGWSTAEKSSRQWRRHRLQMPKLFFTSIFGFVLNVIHFTIQPIGSTWKFMRIRHAGRLTSLALSCVLV